MRVAILSDIHGNQTAFEAVLADLEETAPDLIFHGGDLVHAGASPAEVADRIRDLGWQGVLGNTDEIYTRPESLEEAAGQSTAPPSLWTAIREVAEATRSMLGDERISWLGSLPRVQAQQGFALVHASPESLWRSPGHDASAAELELVYAPLGRPMAVYGHIHRSFVRTLPCTRSKELVVVNAGSVSMSFDGDTRAAYLLLDDSKPTIRRVEYDLEKEISALSARGLPRAEWLARTLRTSCPQRP
jgi:putative phosphoesterase